MKKTEMLLSLNNKITKLKLGGMRRKPEILLALGIAGVGVSIILACIATTKLPEVQENMQNDLDDIHDRLDSEDDTNLQEIKKETTVVYAKTGMKYAVLYASTVVLTGLSISCLIMSNVVLRRRIVGVTAAYATLATSFKDYRGRVVSRYGDVVDKELRYGAMPLEISTVEIDKRGKEKTKLSTINVVDPSAYSDYARIYDAGNIGWTKDPQTNLVFLKCQEAAATQRLKSDGILFLNDVYKMLGFPAIPAGQVIGWMYDEKNPVGDNFVDFGIYDVTREATRNFVNGYERSIMLDFNIDGPILNFI